VDEPVEQIQWRDEEGEHTGPVTELRARFTHALRVKRAPQSGTNRKNLNAALLRWIVFMDIYSIRAVASAPSDQAARAEAAAFLLEASGKSRSKPANRLRQAAAAFMNADPDQARMHLRTAVFLNLRLSIAVTEALTLPLSEPLNGIECRELIYLARAGTRDLKALAARRLVPERHRPDVGATLSQLADDPDACVRAAVRVRGELPAPLRTAIP
jgi:hypothetical protein